MIKARGTGSNGREFVLLGLSHKNLDRLREGRPIQFDGTPYGFPGDVVILADVDEQTLAEKLVGPDTKVRTEEGAP